MKKKILLVDDADLFLEIEKRVFKQTGAELLVAHSGTEALKVLYDKKPDIVLLDLMMPDIPGDRVCSTIKNNPMTARIPVIMVTAAGKAEEVERCRRAGCDDFVTKPIKSQALNEKVVKFLNIPHRQSLRILIRLQFETEKVSSFATSINISTSGMLVETEKKLKVGDKVQFHFYLSSDVEVLGAASVVRQEKYQSGNAFGLRFDSLSKADEQAIARFVESRNR